ncbi:MAG: hypothetical protein ACREP9_19590, partial [Candidatus Dormibacteraceae bacterium]
MANHRTNDIVGAVDQAVAEVFDGRISLAVFDRRKGAMVARYRADQAIPTESVVKLLIALDFLDHGGD